MHMNARTITAIAASLVVATVASAETAVTLRLTGVKQGKGPVYVGLFNSKKGFERKEIFRSCSRPAANTVVTIQLSVPDGEYVFSVFQDINSNGKLDTGAFGLPTEPVGLSNYSGRGMPGSFDKIKCQVNAAHRTYTVPLATVRR
jgi:uncharacterized protein (DUF2141 family)